MTANSIRTQAAFVRRDAASLLSSELLAEFEAFGRDLAAHRENVDRAASRLSTLSERAALLSKEN